MGYLFLCFLVILATNSGFTVGLCCDFKIRFTINNWSCSKEFSIFCHKPNAGWLCVLDVFQPFNLIIGGIQS